jgi:hypothetical protein
VVEEHERMVVNKVFEVVPRANVPSGARILTSTRAMKKKSNGQLRATRLNARGYMQVDGVHYDEDAKYAPAGTGATIHIVLVLIIMAGWAAALLGVKGAFLHGAFEKNCKVYMEVPQGFERFYPTNCVLLLLKTLYGTKQAAKAFWIKLLKALCGMSYTRSKADPCLYFRRTAQELCIGLSWVDGCLIAGRDETIQEAKVQMMKGFDCDEVGELKEYIGCKVDCNKEKDWI